MLLSKLSVFVKDIEFLKLIPRQTIDTLVGAYYEVYIIDVSEAHSMSRHCIKLLMKRAKI